MAVFKERLKLFWLYFIFLFYLELLFKVSIFGVASIFSLEFIYIILFISIISHILSIISKLFSNNRINYLISLLIIIFNVIWYGIHIVFKKIFDTFFSISYLKLADQGLEFKDVAITKMGENISIIIFLIIPIILFITFRKRIYVEKISLKTFIKKIVTIIVLSLVLLLGINILKNSSEAYQLVYKINNNALNQEKLGVNFSTTLDLTKLLVGFEEKISIIDKPNKPEKPDKPDEPQYDSNTLNYDFQKLYDEENNSTVKNMHEYFLNDHGTLKNKYTGLFKDKNLIFITVESLGKIAIDKTLTPTLYNMANSGFVFENFYTPVNLSTLGGEFQVLTSQFANQNVLNDKWKYAKIFTPYGLGHLFKDKGYNTYAFHNGEYYFQGRDDYMKILGFDNYLACGNGIQKLMNCSPWPRSDFEMVEKTMDKFISNKPFMAYYMTNSGHFPYSMSNLVSKQNKENVDGLSYSSKVKAYLSSMIELEKSLKYMIDKLTESGQLDNTVFVLVPDHYPYDLSIDEIKEVAKSDIDPIVEINHNSLIIWNSVMPTIRVTKVASQIDVMPTVYNLFDLPYDSRIFIGKDILSTELGLAFFSNRSWISDFGTYYSRTNEFILKSNSKIPENYVKDMNQLVANRINLSKLIIEYDYYKKIEEAK